MEYLVFLYNLILILFFSACSVGFAIFFLQKKEELFIWLSILFAFFAIENSMLYMVDFIEGFAVFYDNQTLNFPFLKSIVSIIINYSYMQAAAYLANKKPSPTDNAVFAIYVSLLITVPLFETTSFTYWLYFTLSQIFLFYVIWRYIKNKGKLKKNELIFVIVSAVSNLFIIIEDVIVIFFHDDIYSVTARITQRNSCEDMQSVFFAVVAFTYILKEFRNYKSKIDETSEEYIENLHLKKRKAFIKKYELTDRETEIFDLLLLNKTNLEISDELFIAVGTVKNHLHNIYTKTGAAGRADILLVFENLDIKGNIKP